MKTSLFCAASVALLLGHATAQTSWTYDFGTDTGTFTNANTISTNFLPAPPPGGGTARVHVGTNGGGFTLVNPGGGSYLVGAASTGTGTSVDKFSIYDFSAPSSAFSVKFDIKFGAANAGIWSFFAGSGASYGNNAVFSGAQTFTGLRWSFATNGGILSSNRSGSSWQSVGGLGLSQDTPYTMEVLGNNGAAPIIYRGGFTLNPGTYDLWVNDSLAAAGLGKSTLSNSAAIDSFMFYGESSPGNAATIELDNIIYANHIVPEPSKSALLAFAALGMAIYLRRRKGRVSPHRRDAHSGASSASRTHLHLVKYPLPLLVTAGLLLDGAAFAQPAAPAGAQTGQADVVAVVAGDPNLTTLVSALRAAELADVLRGRGPFTVFAPNNAAFAKLPPGTLEDLMKPANKKKLADLLKNHVAKGKVTAVELEPGKIKTLDGGKVAVTKTGGKVTFGDAAVLVADLQAGNGVVHVIDTVVMPD